MATDRGMRASDQDRESAAELLREAYVEGRLSREELDERAAAVYSAATWGELRDVTADLPLPAARTGLPSGIVASRRGPRSAERRLVSQMIWTFVFPLAAGYILNQDAFQQGTLLAPVQAIISAADPVIS
jgi:Domain of unknown function (DUF1707)